MNNTFNPGRSVAKIVPFQGPVKQQKAIKTILVLVIFSISIFSINHLTKAQLTNSTIPTISMIINEKYGKKNYYDNSTKTIYELPATVRVNYESPSTILLSGKFINSVRGTETFNWQLFEAMDLLKNQYGFKLNQVSGIGTPTVYILMTK
jgi:hypothetical protein